MQTENGKIQGRTELTSDLQLQGMWVGDCHVTNGAHLQLHGVVTGNLSVDEGSAATVNGTVSGNLFAHGLVTVAGVVNGHASGDGLTVMPDAVVRGECRKGCAGEAGDEQPT